jgi:hypothetical protein
MADTHIPSHQGWKPRVAVNHGIVLDVRALTEIDGGPISSQYCTKHHYGASLHGDLTDQRRVWCDERVIGNDRRVLSEAQERHKPSLEGPDPFLGALAFSSSLVLHGGL